MDTAVWTEFGISPLEDAANADLRKGDLIEVRSLFYQQGRAVDLVECMTVETVGREAFVGLDASGIIRACSWRRALRWQRGSHDR